MHLPQAFRLDDVREIESLVARHPFAMLAAAKPGGDGVLLDHLPLQLVARGGTRVLRGHLARMNPFARAVATGARVTAVFRGPDTYVTPAAYATKARDPRVVPTWNYSAVHAEGTIAWFDDPARLRELVSTLTDVHEAAHGSAWRLDDAPEPYVQSQLRGIVGLEIEVHSLVGKAKASQNRAAADREGVRDWLRVQGRSADEVAALVREPDA